jgi:transposase, IS5 family
MGQRQDGQFSFVEALLPSGVGRNGKLEKLDALVDWHAFAALLGGLRVEQAVGRPAYQALPMFKALLLQSLYGLSDQGLEEAVADRLSFRRFLGLGLAEEVPDHTTLCRFRNRLAQAGMLELLFAELGRQLDEAGLILRSGSMLDATLIETTAARPPKDPSKGKPSDPDAAFTRRQGRQGSTYGYKAHVGVDQGSGLIRKAVTTPANVNDTVVADDLISGDERAVLADSAYHTHERAKALRAKGVKARLMRRPNKHHPELPPRLKRFNQLIARRRAQVETTFATLKRRMGLNVIRYRGLAKAQAQVMLAALAFNLKRWAALAP